MTDEIKPNKPKKRFSLLRKLAIVFGGLLALLVVFYFVGTSSAFFKGVILPRVGKALHADVTVADAEISPFSRVSLRALKIQSPGYEPLLQADQIVARYNLGAIIHGKLKIDELTIVSPVISIIEDANGRNNLDPLRENKNANSSKGESSKSSKPEKTKAVEIKNVALKNATVHKIKKYKDGHQEVVEISGLNISLDQLRNGQSGKFSIAAALKMDPGTKTNGVADRVEAKLAGALDFTLTENLLPKTLQGNVRLDVSTAQGNFAELADLAAIFEADLTPSEFKNVAVRFEQHGKKLPAEMRLSGTFDAAKIEGKLRIALLSLDRQVLNLLGAAQGIDFGATTINSTNQIDFRGLGQPIKIDGQLSGKSISLNRTNKNMEPIDLGAAYNVTVNQASRTGLVDNLLITLSPTARAKNEVRLRGAIDLSHLTAIQGHLSAQSDSLDITTCYDSMFGKPAAAAKSPTAEAPDKPATRAPAGAAEEPKAITLPLKNFVVELDVAKFYLREIEMTGFQARAKMDGGSLVLDPLQTALNGAPVKGRVDLNTGVAGFTYNVNLSADKIPLEPIANSFVPEKRGAYQGQIIANGQIKGAGITGPSLKKNLSAKVNLSFTNANLQIVGPRLRSFLGALSLALQSPELSASPLKYAAVDVSIANGTIDLQRLQMQSDAFNADTRGQIPMADVLDNSPLNNLPMDFGLSRNLAQRTRLVSSGSASDGPYVALPNLIKVTGTIGAPKPSIDKRALLGSALEKYGGKIPGVNEQTGKLLQGFGGLIGGQSPAQTNTSTNSSSQTQTNQASPANPLLDLLKRSKK
jgi:hypothetical protein